MVVALAAGHTLGIEVVEAVDQLPSLHREFRDRNAARGGDEVFRCDDRTQRLGFGQLIAQSCLPAPPAQLLIGGKESGADRFFALELLLHALAEAQALVERELFAFRSQCNLIGCTNVEIRRKAEVAVEDIVGFAQKRKVSEIEGVFTGKKHQALLVVVPRLGPPLHAGRPPASVASDGELLFPVETRRPVPINRADVIEAQVCKRGIVYGVKVEVCASGQLRTPASSGVVAHIDASLQEIPTFPIPRVVPLAEVRCAAQGTAVPL